MRNRKFITSIVLASIFLAPALALAEDKDSEFQAGQIVKDSAITTQIKAKLLVAESIDSLRVTVDTDNNGVVVLTGTVKTEEEKERVQNIANSVDGVRKVINRLEMISNQ